MFTTSISKLLRKTPSMEFWGIRTTSYLNRSIVEAQDQMIPQVIVDHIERVKRIHFGTLEAGAETRYFFKHIKIDEFTFTLDGQEYIDRKLCEESSIAAFVGEDERQNGDESGYQGTHVSFIAPNSAAAVAGSQVYKVLWNRKFNPDAHFYQTNGWARIKDNRWVRYVICEKLREK